MSTLKTTVLHPHVTHNESWETEARLEGQLGHWAAGGTGSAIPRHCRGTGLQNTIARASAARPLSHPVLPLWLRAAINTAQQDGAPWQLQKPGESTLQQPCRKYEMLFFREETWKVEILRKKKLSAWRECIGNLGTKRSFAILSVYFPCTEYWFLAKKKITNWGNLKKKKKIPLHCNGAMRKKKHRRKKPI